MIAMAFAGLLVWFCMLLFFVVAAAMAPEGYEDAGGFHCGSKE